MLPASNMPRRLGQPPFNLPRAVSRSNRGRVNEVFGHDSTRPLT